MQFWSIEKTNAIFWKMQKFQLYYHDIFTCSKVQKIRNRHSGEQFFNFIFSLLLKLCIFKVNFHFFCHTAWSFIIIWLSKFNINLHKIVLHWCLVGHDHVYTYYSAYTIIFVYKVNRLYNWMTKIARLIYG